jgi:hypothetical protein
VRRNGRNEARREVTLPWFQEEGSQLSQLGGYRIILEIFRSPFSRCFGHLSRDFCATKLWPKFRVDPPNSRDRKPGSTRGNHFAHSFLLRFSLPSSCLNSAFRIDISGGLRTSSQEKKRNERRVTTTTNARTDPTSQQKTSEKTPTPAITRQSPHLNLL